MTNPDWLKSLLEASCEGSLSPGRCYDELTSLADQLKGPSSVKGPSSSTTSTYTRPDGTTGTTNTTTETNYTINYGPNYFDYSKTTTTTTSKDGEKPTTTTETESPEVTGRSLPLNLSLRRLRHARQTARVPHMKTSTSRPRKRKKALLTTICRV